MLKDKCFILFKRGRSQADTHENLPIIIYKAYCTLYTVVFMTNFSSKQGTLPTVALKALVIQFFLKEVPIATKI